MGTVGSQVSVKVYIDGVCVPVSRVETIFQVGQAAVANIHLVPTSEFYQIKPRALVHVFYLTEATRRHDPVTWTTYTKRTTTIVEDSFERTETTESVRGESFQFEPPGIATKDSKILKGSDYKLLFFGEYAGYFFTRTAAGRTLVMQCIDPSNNLDTIKQHSSNSKSGGIEHFENAFLGVQNDRTSKTFQGKDLSANLTRWIAGTKHFPEGSGKGVRNTVTGVHRMVLESFCVSNVFWAKQLVRTRFSDLLVGLQGDETADKLFNAKVFKKYLKRRIAGTGSHTSLRQCLDFILGTLYYNMVTIPSPKMAILDGEKMKPYNNNISHKNDKKKHGLHNYNYNFYRNFHNGTSLNYLLIKPDLWFLPPPTCNIIFPDMYTNFTTKRIFLGEPTRLMSRTEQMAKRKGSKVSYEAVWDENQSSPTEIKPAYYKKRITGGGGGATYIANRVYAPDFQAFNPLLSQPTRGQPLQGWKSRLESVIMPHEKFVGPNSAFSWQGDIGAFGTKKERKKYVSLATDYLFWKMYFGERQGTINCIFSPQMVPGFSFLIIDKLDPAKKGEPNPNIGKHHYGYISSITHTISTDMAQTDISFAACRPHDENIDFDNVDNPNNAATFEEVILKGTAGTGYYDDRYLPNNVAKHFYWPILGCGSVLTFCDGLDTFSPSTTREIGANMKEAANAIAQEYYGVATGDPTYFKGIKVNSSGKPESGRVGGADATVRWTQGITRRRHLATETDMMGGDTWVQSINAISNTTHTHTNYLPGSSGDMSNTIGMSSENETWVSTQGATIEAPGFHEACVNPNMGRSNEGVVRTGLNRWKSGGSALFGARFKISKATIESLQPKDVASDVQPVFIDNAPKRERRSGTTKKRNQVNIDGNKFAANIKSKRMTAKKEKMLQSLYNDAGLAAKQAAEGDKFKPYADENLKKLNDHLAGLATTKAGAAKHKWFRSISGFKAKREGGRKWTSYVVTPTFTPTSYGLKEELEERREGVEAYYNSVVSVARTGAKG
tara:strand:+ start:3588 stop:6605 length:3018 start_codon:yes stop_codon:yes gene_type:complete